MDRYAQVCKFWQLAQYGRSAALDINHETGELVCLFSESINGQEGLGCVPASYGHSWVRIVTSTSGFITRNSI